MHLHTMSDLQSRLPVEEILDHAVLDDVHRFWFRHIEDEERLVVPSQQDPLVWFSQNDDFDHECSYVQCLAICLGD